jgi:uncharacterized membrane protein
MQRVDNPRTRAERLSKGLGWFSIGLGLAELSAPRTIARLAGVHEDDSTESVVRALGAREIASGVAILAQPDHAKWVWSRVGGDVIDLSFLGSAIAARDSERGRAIAATVAVIGVTALDVACAALLSRGVEGGRSRRNGVRVEEVTTINRPIDEVYSFWRNFENLPRFMRHLESVQQINDRQSRWKAKAPAGMSVEWQAETVQDVRDEWIAWRSIEGSDVQNSGSVRFRRAPGARGTEVRVQLQYNPPAGALGRGVAWLFGEAPEQQIHEDLHRFKQLMEAGEIPISEGPGLSRPAQPPARPEDIKDLVGVQS